MTVVHLIGQLGRGGTEKQLFSTAAGLQRRGWHQTVIAFDTGGMWVPLLKDAGIPVFVVPRDGLKLRRLWRLWRLVRREKPEILLSWSSYVAAYARLLRGVGPLRRVYNLREDVSRDCDRPERKRSLRLAAAGMEAADHVVSNSQRNLDLARQHGIRLPPSSVIFNLVVARGGAQPAASISCPRIGAVGSLIPSKNYDVLLLALGTLAAAGLQFELSLAGDGPERPALENLARRLGVADRVKFLGDVEDVPRLLSTAHFFAHPSRSEGLSNAVLEAMAAGLPVVACPVGATGEIIEDGKNGILVPAGAPQDLAAAMRRLLSDAALRGRLGKAGWETVRQLCDENVVLDRYEGVLRGLLAAGCEKGASR
jgi:glycosyltransferase involved in cell wall biosynthesis